MQSQLKQHLAIATGAVSTAAVPLGADAAIVYKDNTNAFSVSYAGPTSAEWDVDGTGGNDFQIWSDNTNLYFNSDFRNGFGFVGPVGGSYSFRNIASGFAVGPGLGTGYGWAGSGSVSYRGIMASSNVYGNFDNGVIGRNFIGFRFLSGSDLLYGWAELILSTTGGGTVTVNRWAYNDEANGSIKVGETGQEVPAPSTLALLAAGAFGLRHWRARRRAAA